MPLADLDHLASGKIRDVYRVDDDHVLLVASDRISAFDHVLSPPVPDKGRVLTALSVWWFEQLDGTVAHHFVSVDDPRIPEDVRGRAMMCRSLSMVPVECVARGYLAGSGVADYRATGTVCGVALPAGLQDGSRLPEPIFTPTTKGAVGEHDLPMTYPQVVDRVGEDVAARLRASTLATYAYGERVTRERGILLADTKFEFGYDSAGTLRLGDEVLTPDSSRFWPAGTWQPGRTQRSYDKQYVRDWLLATDWDRASAPPSLPEAVLAATRARYVDAYELLTGRSFSDWFPGSG